MKGAMSGWISRGWRVLVLVLGLGLRAKGESSAVVYLTDFGLKDGAVSAMKGVAHGVDPGLKQFDLTHEIPPFAIWDAACRLKQAVAFWPKGTVFVSVVDPGVGTDRRSVVAKTKLGHWIVTPDNGTLTFLASDPGLEEIRVIDTARQRLKGSEASHTFHGRDVFAYVAARLASGKLRFRDVGSLSTQAVVRLPFQTAEWKGDVLRGTLTVADPHYGNVWSNIPKALLDQAGGGPGQWWRYRILNHGERVAEGRAPWSVTFGQVAVGEPLLYINSLLEVALALNQGDFVRQFQVGHGPGWILELQAER